MRRKASSRRFSLLFVLVTVLVFTGQSTASSKGGWRWHLWDRDGFLIVGQQVRAQANFPDTMPYPTHALLIEIDWEAQPRSMPRRRVVLDKLEPERFRLRGERLVSVELTFVAPAEPGDYAIVTCIQPCHDIETYPAPSPVNVVADASEARLRTELLERDASIDRLAHRLRRSRAFVGDLRKQVDEQLGYLGNHVTRIGDLEKMLDEGVEESHPTGSLAVGAGLLGCALGFAAGGRYRKQRAATREGG